MTTVGYGDMSPETMLGRIVGASSIPVLRSTTCYNFLFPLTTSPFRHWVRHQRRPGDGPAHPHHCEQLRVLLQRAEEAREGDEAEGGEGEGEAGGAREAGGVRGGEEEAGAVGGVGGADQVGEEPDRLDGEQSAHGEDRRQGVIGGYESNSS